jgi:hypothetical protein
MIAGWVSGEFGALLVLNKPGVEAWGGVGRDNGGRVYLR